MKPQLPAALQRGLEEKRLVVLAGSGISRLSPSYVPIWSAYNNSLFTALRACAEELPGIATEARAAIAALPLPDTKIFSDLIARLMAGEGYFPILNVLEGREPNSNHLALAELARKGVLRAIVTTNFDTLIERAFRREGVPLVELVRSADYEQLRADGLCVLAKIHGSIGQPETFVDTASQKLKGLPRFVRARLAELYRGNHVLVVGFSGEDLDFGEDYLAFAESGGYPEITWARHPGSELAPAAARFLAKSGGVSIELDASSLFGLLGVAPAALDPADRAPQDAVQEEVARAARDFFHRPYLGPLYCSSFCASLLSRAGMTSEARSVYSALRAYVESLGDRLPKTAAPALRSLAIAARDDEELDIAEFWARREIAFWQAALASVRIPPGDPSFDLNLALAEGRRGLAAAWSVLGRIHLDQMELEPQKIEDARSAFQEADQLARANGNATLLAITTFNDAILARAEREPPDDVIDLFRKSAELAASDGAAEVASEALLHQSLEMIGLAEYDLPWLHLDRASGYAKLAGNLDLSVRISDARERIKELRTPPPVGSVHSPQLRFHGEERLRRNIALFEMAGFRQPITDTFSELCWQAWKRKSPWRSLDLAYALFFAAKRDDYEPCIIEAMNCSGAARFLAGDREGAAKDFESLLSREMVPEPVRELVERNLEAAKSGRSEPETFRFGSDETNELIAFIQKMTNAAESLDERGQTEQALNTLVDTAGFVREVTEKRVDTSRGLLAALLDYRLRGKSLLS